MVVARVVAGAGSVLAMLSLSGCGFLWDCTDTTAERGEPGVRVEIEDERGRAVDVTAEVPGWRREPHPQAPAEGDRIRFRIRLEGAGMDGEPAVDACAVDEDRVVLGCQRVYSSEGFIRGDVYTDDGFIAADHPERVAEVLLIPNDQSLLDRTTCEDDMKDGGGVHPPDMPVPGDQL